MATLNLVLVEPEIPQNTGNVARTCAATGTRLHLVKPMGFEPDDKKLKRAGLDYWHLLDITYYESIDDFFEKTKGGKYFFFSTKGTHRHSDVEYPDNCYLLFGKENGLFGVAVKSVLVALVGVDHVEKLSAHAELRDVAVVEGEADVSVVRGFDDDVGGYLLPLAVGSAVVGHAGLGVELGQLGA